MDISNDSPFSTNSVSVDIKGDNEKKPTYGVLIVCWTSTQLHNSFKAPLVPQVSGTLIDGVRSSSK